MSHPFSRDTRVPKTKHPLYHRWCTLKQLINNPEHVNYHSYGGRGLTISREWETNFTAFLLWSAKSGYKKGLTLTRRDKNKGFDQDNCMWVTNDHQVEL